MKAFPAQTAMDQLASGRTLVCGCVLRIIVWPLILLPALAAQSGWVAETPHFRVVVAPIPSLDADAATGAAEALETIRSQFFRDGLGLPTRADGPLDVLVVANKLELHSLLRLPPNSGTRGITLRGLDRDYVVVPWHGNPGPRVTLAHEYAHQLEPTPWPLWFQEGRAVYLARRTVPAFGPDSRLPLIEMLSRATWFDWDDLMAADDADPIAESRIFQAQAWLLIHWLASQKGSLADLDLKGAEAAVSRLGLEHLAATLRRHLVQLDHGLLEPLAPFVPPNAKATVREAAEWEVPLLEAEIQRELGLFSAAGPRLREIASRFCDEARAQAAYAAFLLVQRQPDAAERRFRAAIELGDGRARTAYRYAILMMRPGDNPKLRVARALDAALQARTADPATPIHHLAVVHARMLHEDWGGAFAELRTLLRFPGWSARADREAEETRRRRAQVLREVAVPEISPRQVGLAPVRVPPAPAAWKPPSPPVGLSARSRRWPPYGTWLVHGTIAWVNCAGGERTVILHSPYKRYALRENPAKPPELINRPFRAKVLSCGARGYQVQIAFKKLPGNGAHDGEIVGIRF